MSDAAVISIEYDAYPSIGFPRNVAIAVGFADSVTGATSANWYQTKKIFFILASQPDGSVKVTCGNWAVGHAYNLPTSLFPSNCTETSISTSYN